MNEQFTREELKDAPSFASPLKPHDTHAERDQYINLWGRFWGVDSGLNCAFCIQYNTEQSTIREFTLSQYDSPGNLKSHDPDQAVNSFLEELRNARGPNVQSSEYQLVRNTFEHYLSNETQQARLHDSLSQKDRLALKDWCRNFFFELFETDEFTFQIKGRITHGESEFRENEGKTTESDSSSLPDDTESSKDQQDMITVEFLTSPVRGIQPSDLRESQVVLCRMIGSVVKNLPEKLIDTINTDQSIPIPAKVEQIEQNPSQETTPNDIPDKNLENMVLITVSMDDSLRGIGLIPESTKIKTPENERRLQTQEEDTDDRFAILLGILAIFLSISLWAVLA